MQAPVPSESRSAVIQTADDFVQQVSMARISNVAPSVDKLPRGEIETAHACFAECRLFDSERQTIALPTFIQIL